MQLFYLYLQAAFEHFELQFINLFHITFTLAFPMRLTLTQEKTTEIENVTKKDRSLYLLKELDVNKILNVTSSPYTCPCP